MDLETNSWLSKVSEVERLLLIQADLLLTREKQLPPDSRIADYGYLVYSAAKAYEGFIKDFLYRNRLIDLATYNNENFRIGKALNPDLPQRFRDEGWYYGDLERLFGEDLPNRMWSTWRKCRNHVFHFRPDKLKLYTLVEAQLKVELVFSTIKLAVERENNFKNIF